MYPTCLCRLAALFVAAFLLGACAAAPTEQAAGGAQATSLVIGTGDDATLKFVPNTVQAPANTAITLTYKNGSTQPHNLQLPAPISAKTKLVVAAGASDTITFTTPAPGTYKFLCSIHPGMVGTLHIT